MKTTVDRNLWGNINPKYPNAYRGGSVKLIVTRYLYLRASWTQSGSAWRHGVIDGAMNRSSRNWALAWFKFVSFPRHATHFSIGRLTFSAVRELH